MSSARWLPFVLLSLAGCAAQPPQAAKPKPTPAPVSTVQTDPDAEQEKMLDDARLAIKSGLPQQAIDRALDPIISTFEQRYGHSERRVYSARTPAEMLFYSLDAAAHKQSSIVVGAVWAEAYHLKAYALLDLARMDEARAALDKALALAPQNAGLLEELGAHYEAEKNWPKAMETFERAEKAAETYSPPALRNDELARAWRGQAFVDVETGKLDQAEQLYLRCLELDKNDKRAAGELGYVRKKRQERESTGRL